MYGGILLLPAGAVIRHFGIDGDEKICIWAEANPDNEDCRVDYEIVYTGDTIPDDKFYASTCINKDGYVWHLYINNTIAK